jgi:hypothetical protein
MASSDSPHRRAALLEQMAQLHSMERGTLSEEYRERPDGSRGTVRLGPYFKLKSAGRAANALLGVDSSNLACSGPKHY